MSTLSWLCVVGVWGIVCSLYGDREGKKRGYREGAKDMEEWFIKQGAAVEKEWQNIRKEEGTR